jgi:hypothetical protein
MDITKFCWEGHAEKIEKETVKSVYRAKTEGSGGRGRPKLRWIYSVNAGIEMEGLFIK